MKNKGKNLFNNTILFMIGNIGSKFIQFLLVPLYTYALTTVEYGTTDLFFTTINFLIPIFSIQISDGFLRFGFDKKFKKNDVVTSSFRVAFIGTLLSVLLLPILFYFPSLKKYSFFLILILNLQIYRDLFSIYLKIIEKNKLYTINNIIYTFILCLANFIFLIPFDLGINGYFLAYVVSNILSILIMIYTVKFNVKSLFRKVDISLMKQITIYCLPLIINSLSYWITMASDRFMINALLGTSFVGIYAISCKIPTIISTFTGIFSQAWMLSSFSEFENGEDSKFSNSIFNNYISILFIISSFLLFILKPFISIYVSSEYFSSWQASSILILSVIFSGLCAFTNGIFYAHKKNVSVTVTTLIGSIINIILNIILINKFKVIGAALATLVSWVFVFVSRYIILEKLVDLKTNLIKFILAFLFLICEVIILFYVDSILSYILNFMFFVLICLIYNEFIKNIFYLIKSFKKKVK